MTGGQRGLRQAHVLLNDCRRRRDVSCRQLWLSKRGNARCEEPCQRSASKQWDYMLLERRDFRGPGLANA